MIKFNPKQFNLILYTLLIGIWLCVGAVVVVILQTPKEFKKGIMPEINEQEKYVQNILDRHQDEIELMQEKINAIMPSCFIVNKTH